MNAFEGYFRTLRLLLPKGQRDDILHELSEEIRSQAAEQEAATGRPLTPDEQAAIISHYGHPLVTAARYRPQRYLVGPIVFPYYWLVLKLAVGLTIAAHAVGAVLLLAGGASFAQMGHSVEATVATVLKELGWLTVLAA
jgi:hypothetical protein